MLIFITRLFFRRSHRRTATPLKYRLPFYPAGSVAGALLMAALLVMTLFTEQFSMTILFGVPFALAVSALYFLMCKRMRPAQDEAEPGLGLGSSSRSRQGRRILVSACRYRCGAPAVRCTGAGYPPPALR